MKILEDNLKIDYNFAFNPPRYSKINYTVISLSIGQKFVIKYIFGGFEFIMNQLISLQNCAQFLIWEFRQDFLFWGKKQHESSFLKSVSREKLCLQGR